MFAPQRTSILVSIALPFSVNGLLMLLVFGAFSGILAFCEFVLGSAAAGLSGAMVVVFGLIGVSYVARCLLAVGESSAEGYDGAPPLPNPLAVEDLFGAFFGLVALSFFAFGPLILLQVFGVRAAWVHYGAVALGMVYLPMALLGQGVQQEVSGAMPTRVIPAIVAGMHRYFPSILLAACAGFLALAIRDGTFSRMPGFALHVADVVVGWLLFAAVHRAGVVHRECAAVRAILPVPDPVISRDECAIPHRPMSDIERALWEREKENSSQ